MSFKSVFTEEEAFTESNVIEAHEEFQEVVVQNQDVCKLLGSLDIRKAMGPDAVSSWTPRECEDQLIQPFWDVITSSINREGKVPQEWKRTNIVPICKGGNKADHLNYRPMSLTSVISKICQILIKKKWVRCL